MRKMKDSGIEWIGEIPEDWEVCKLKPFLQWKSVKGFGNETVLSLYRDFGIIPKESRDDNHNVTSLDTDSYKLVEIGDFVINKMKAWQGSMAISNYRGIVSPAYHVCSIKNSKIYKPYFHYLMRNKSYLPEYERLSSGLRIGQWDLSFEDFCQIKFIIPSFIEQQRIADFLEKKCSEIDSVISKTSETIEEYKKLKQSIITEVVTGKVKIENEKACGKYDIYKDSGIEWIGEIPSEWSVIRTKFISDSMSKGNGITKEQIVQNGDSPCVRYGEIYSKYNHSFSNCITKTNKSMYTNLQYFSYGDILFACTGELPEEIGKNIVYLGNEDCLAGGDIIVMKHSQNPSFLNYVYNSYGQTQKSLGKTKLKVVHISATEIANIFVALPSIPVQQQISDFLDKKCSEIDKLITKKEQLVVELESYKKSLIYEVVTGKREV